MKPSLSVPGLKMDFEPRFNLGFNECLAGTMDKFAMSRNPKKQPFMVFCDEQKQIIQQLKQKRLPEVIEYCGPIWAKMTPLERQPYKDGSKGFSGSQSLNARTLAEITDRELAGKFDNFGQSMRERKRTAVTKEYYDAIAAADIDLRFRGEGQLGSRVLIMSAHMWCVTDLGKVYPAEFGITEFSTTEGVTNRWYELLKPITIPKCYKSEFFRRSEFIHQIDLRCEDLSMNYVAIFEELVSIVKAKENERYAGMGVDIQGFDEITEPEEFSSARKHKLIPICVLPSDRETVDQALKWFSGIMQSDIKFPLLDLSQVLTIVLNSAPNLETFPVTEAISESFLTEEILPYTPKVSCKYHESVESSKCACAKTTRAALIYLDLACQVYKIRNSKNREKVQSAVVGDRKETNINRPLEMEDVPEELSNPGPSTGHILAAMMHLDAKGDLVVSAEKINMNDLSVKVANISLDDSASTSGQPLRKAASICKSRLSHGTSVLTDDQW